MKIDFCEKNLPSPCYVVDEGLLLRNLKILREVADAAGCKILLAQKAFSMFALYPLIAEYLDGTAASGLHEARLSHDYFVTRFKKENHVFSGAYSDAEFEAVLPLCSHIIFNSFSQWDRFKARGAEAFGNSGQPPRTPFSNCSCAEKQLEVADFSAQESASSGFSKVAFGIRINPELSTQGGGIYDPCAAGSRLGVTRANFRFEEMGGKLNGIHFHTLCQQNSDALEMTLAAVEKNFGACFEKIAWINMGGGHHITRDDYDRERLVAIISGFKKRHGLEVYLEPGEAVALNAGFLHATVLDIVNNDGGEIAILDASAACHMPDVLEMPYRPRIIGAGEKSELPHTYRLGGATCLAGDFIGEYSFEKPLRVGSTLIFEDMAIYSMVKNNTFNGMNLPAISIRRTSGEVEIIRRFSYPDFRDRLS